MSKREVEIVAFADTDGSKMLHGAGIFDGPLAEGALTTTDLHSQTIAVRFRERRFDEILSRLPDPVRVAFRKASAEMDKYKLTDVFRFWEGWSGDICGDDHYEPLRETRADITGFPGAVLEVSKYRSVATTVIDTLGTSSPNTRQRSFP
jgi:hypothetical protein